MGDSYVTATHPALNSVCCYTLGGKPPCPKKKGGGVQQGGVFAPQGLQQGCNKGLYPFLKKVNNGVHGWEAQSL